MAVDKEYKPIPISVRLMPEVREMMLKLIDMMSADLKIRVSKSQAIEIAIREAFEKRADKGEKK